MSLGSREDPCERILHLHRRRQVARKRTHGQGARIPRPEPRAHRDALLQTEAGDVLDDGLLLRFTGETLALAPPFIATDVEIRSAVDTLRRALVATAAQAGQAP